MDTNEKHDVGTTGWVDRGPSTDSSRTGATAVPGPRPEAGATVPTTDRAVPAGNPEEPPLPSAQPAAEAPTATELPAGAHPTAPVSGRPRPRAPRRDPLIRMGPWAPVAGAAVGLVLGIVVVLLLAPAVTTFAERLALVFVVLGLALLGAGGTLLTDEVRLLRRGTQAIEARSASAGVIAGLLNGLTPARLLILASAFVLLLSAWVTTRA